MNVYLISQFPIMLAPRSPKNLEEANEIIEDLKEKLHQAFIDMSDTEKLCQGQIEAQKENY